MNWNFVYTAGTCGAYLLIARIGELANMDLTLLKDELENILNKVLGFR